MSLLRVVAVGTMLLAVGNAIAQDRGPESAPPLEGPPDGAFVPPPAFPRTSPPGGGRGVFNNVQVNTDGGGLNILGDAGNETSMVVDPHRPNRMAIGWRQFNTVASNFSEAGYAWSRDGGRTWARSVIEPGVFRTDPVLDVDADGVFFYYSLRTNAGYLCDMFRCTTRDDRGSGRSSRTAATRHGSRSTAPGGLATATSTAPGAPAAGRTTSTRSTVQPTGHSRSSSLRS
ncbi:MAG: hypothetical protein H7Y88_12175 [Phycisphaerales bacterium]|nr:hypothetical protein [Phycisphaerales bacterium]